MVYSLSPIPIIALIIIKRQKQTKLPYDFQNLSQQEAGSGRVSGGLGLRKQVGVVCLKDTSMVRAPSCWLVYIMRKFY